MNLVELTNNPHTIVLPLPALTGIFHIHKLMRSLSLSVDDNGSWRYTLLSMTDNNDLWDSTHISISFILIYYTKISDIAWRHDHRTTAKNTPVWICVTSRWPDHLLTAKNISAQIHVTSPLETVHDGWRAAFRFTRIHSRPEDWRTLPYKASLGMWHFLTTPCTNRTFAPLAYSPFGTHK